MGYYSKYKLWITARPTHHVRLHSSVFRHPVSPMLTFPCGYPLTSVSVQVQGQGFVEQEYTTDNGEGGLACNTHTYRILYCSTGRNTTYSERNSSFGPGPDLLREAGCVLL